MDFGAHTPYVLTAYAVSIIALASLIGWRIVALKKATSAAETASTETP